VGVALPTPGRAASADIAVTVTAVTTTALGPTLSAAGFVVAPLVAVTVASPLVVARPLQTIALPSIAVGALAAGVTIDIANLLTTPGLLCVELTMPTLSVVVAAPSLDATISAALIVVEIEEDC
jgi:hypothetical protein